MDFEDFFVRASSTVHRSFFVELIRFRGEYISEEEEKKTHYSQRDRNFILSIILFIIIFCKILWKYVLRSVIFLLRNTISRKLEIIFLLIYSLIFMLLLNVCFLFYFLPDIEGLFFWHAQHTAADNLLLLNVFISYLT